MLICVSWNERIHYPDCVCVCARARERGVIVPMGGPSDLRDATATFARKAVRTATTGSTNNLDTVELSQWIRALYLGTQDAPASYRDLLLLLAKWTKDILSKQTPYASALVICADYGMKEEKGVTSAERKKRLHDQVQNVLIKFEVGSTVEEFMTEVGEVAAAHLVLLTELLAPETTESRQRELLETQIPAHGVEPRTVWEIMLRYTGFTAKFYEVVRWFFRQTLEITGRQNIFTDINGVVGHTYLDDTSGKYIRTECGAPVLVNDIVETDLKVVFWIRKLVPVFQSLGIAHPRVVVHSSDNDIYYILLLNMRHWEGVVLEWQYNEEAVLDVGMALEAILAGAAKEFLAGKEAPEGGGTAGYAALGTCCLLQALCKTDYTKGMPQAGINRMRSAFASVVQKSKKPLPVLLAIIPTTPFARVIVNKPVIKKIFKAGLLPWVWEKGVKEGYNWKHNLARVWWMLTYWCNGGFSKSEPTTLYLQGGVWVHRDPVPSGVGHGFARRADGGVVFAEMLQDERGEVERGGMKTPKRVLLDEEGEEGGRGDAKERRVITDGGEFKLSSKLTDEAGLFD